MAKVTNLVLKLQTGSDNTYFATWAFGETTTTTSSAIKAGNLVSIKSGATYYNGVSIPAWVMADQWYVTQVKGDRAVLGKNKSGTNNIVSPINTKYLTGGTGTTVSTNTLDHYTVKWHYATGDGIWFEGGSSDVTSKQATYSPPTNATKIKVSVKPVSKTRKVNGKDTAYWSGTNVSAELLLSEMPPEKPSTPSVTVEKFKLTAKLENIPDARADEMQFEVYNGTKVVNSGIATVATRQASFSCTISAGGEYRVRCRAVNLNGNTRVYGEWSDFSGTETTIPAAPTKITVCRAASETSVYLEWTAANSATSYDIEYTTELRYFDGSDQTTTINGIESTHYEKTGLESGDQYYFRVRAVNSDGHSSWTEPQTVIIGDEPSAPTTWSSSTTVITGEPLTLYWMHNSADGSSQTYAELELTINGTTETYTIKNSEDEDEKGKTSSYSVDTTPYAEGTKIQWRVRTAGVTKAYGDWSVQRTIDIYAPPTLEVTLKDAEGDVVSTVTSLPLYISALPGPNTQAPIGYHLAVISNEIYETVDQIGNVKLVNAGDEVYSNYFDINEELLVELSAQHIDLENGIDYTVVCTVSMDSGLTAETQVPFNVSWTDEQYDPDVEIAVDPDTLVAYIHPYCRDEEGASIEGLSLSVYRREYDGRFTEIATGLDNTANTVVTDPHPALDYARYRVVAISDTTGAVSFYDAPGYPVGGDSIIIQWDEAWSAFDTDNEDVMEQPPWSGSLLRLPFNVDISDGNQMDVSLVKYIGRSHPIAYYGTQLGTTSTWNTVIRRDDEETLYALRRLAIWPGDVYVREPSGSGYWANISVSYNQKHKDVTIPVTFDVTRVEGGM